MSSALGPATLPRSSSLEDSLHQEGKSWLEAEPTEPDLLSTVLLLCGTYFPTVLVSEFKAVSIAGYTDTGMGHFLTANTGTT